jgi:CHAD domain-containing protein
MSQPTPIRGLRPDSRLTQAARRLLIGRLTDVRLAREGLEAELGREAVHDARVATRRLRAALHLFRDLGELEPLEKDVKHLQDALGEVRDLHVQGEWLGQSAREARQARRTGYTALEQQVTAPLEQKERRLRTALKRWDEHTVPALENAAEHLKGSGRYGGKRVRKQLRRRLHSLHTRMKDYARAPEPQTAHAIRKMAKKLRYEAELVRPAMRREMKTLQKALVPMQEVLGELHDADVRLELLEGLASKARGPRRTAARELLERVRAEREEQAAHIARELERWHSERLVHGLKQLLA